MRSHDVIGHVTIRLLTNRLPGVDFLSVVHGDHASIWNRYGDMAPQMLDARTLTLKKIRKKGKKKGKGRGKRERKSEKEKGRKKTRRK